MKNNLLILLILSLVTFSGLTSWVWVGFGLYLYWKFFNWVTSLKRYEFREDDRGLRVFVFLFLLPFIPLLTIISWFDKECPNAIVDIWRAAWKEIGYKVKFHKPITFDKIKECME